MKSIVIALFTFLVVVGSASAQRRVQVNVGGCANGQCGVPQMVQAQARPVAPVVTPGVQVNVNACSAGCGQRQGIFRHRTVVRVRCR